MPVTLEQARQNAVSAYDQKVIDEFRTNALMEGLPFADVVSPVGGGGTLTYSYRRVESSSDASFRAVNSEYAPTEATTKQYHTDLKVLGGAYQIDRVIAKVGPAATGEIAFQTTQKVKAVNALFGDAMINGDSAGSGDTGAVDSKDSFDGLAKALKGSTTEDTATHDWSGTMDQAKAFQILSDVDELLAAVDGQASRIIGNRKAIQLLKAASRFANQYVEKVGPRDTLLPTYAGAILVDAGYKPGGKEEVIPVAPTAKTTALYAVRYGLDGFHGVTTLGSNLISTFLPDFKTPGAVKTGEVELGPVGVALKATRAAAVMTKIKVAA